MSDIRDELEKNFASADMQSDVQKGELEDSEEVLKATEKSFETYTAPKSYTKEFQEDFKELSPKWQEYLATREKQTEKGFSLMGNKLNAYKWAEKLFDDRAERLKAAGFDKPQDYIEKLVEIDDELEQNPAGVLEQLAQIYGVQNVNNNHAFNDWQARLWQHLQSAQKDFENRQFDAACFDVERFENATDDNGNLRHPFYQDVKDEMKRILKSGGANDLQEAYAKAVWAKPETRDKMIENRIQAILEEKMKAAQMAKDASFLANSKAVETPKELSLREELEAQFKKEF